MELFMSEHHRNIRYGWFICALPGLPGINNPFSYQSGFVTVAYWQSTFTSTAFPGTEYREFLEQKIYWWLQGQTSFREKCEVNKITTKWFILAIFFTSSVPWNLHLGPSSLPLWHWFTLCIITRGSSLSFLIVIRVVILVSCWAFTVPADHDVDLEHLTTWRKKIMTWS